MELFFHLDTIDHDDFEYYIWNNFYLDIIWNTIGLKTMELFLSGILWSTIGLKTMELFLSGYYGTRYV